MATNIIPFTNSTANAILRKPLFDDLIDEPEHDEPITHLHSILKKHMRETDVEYSCYSIYLQLFATYTIYQPMIRV